MLGWDVRRQGLGFALERADALAVSPPLMRSLGRTPGVQGVNERREDAWGVRTQSGIHLVGRIVLNVWRCARSELQLCSYSLQNVAYKLLGVRCPDFAHRDLTSWWDLSLIHI